MDKELMDCLLNEDEINESWSSYQFSEDMYKDMLIHMRSVLKAQLQSPKLKAYIDSQTQDLQIELQMANDSISDFRGELAELKAKVQDERERILAELGMDILLNESHVSTMNFSLPHIIKVLKEEVNK